MAYQPLIGCLLALVLFVCQPTWAAVPGFGPERFLQHRNATSSSSLQYGIGVYFAPENLPLYAEPNLNAQPVDVLSWSSKNSHSLMVRSTLNRRSMPASRRFIGFYPTLQLALLPVLQENGQGWAEVVVDPRRQTTAWVPLRHTFHPKDSSDWPAHWATFQPWLDVIRQYGRKNGIQWLPGVANYHQQLRMQPNDDAELLNLTMIRKITIHHARGPWLLVEAWDFNRESPIGWVRWREDAGQLLVFPNFGQRQTMVVPGRL